MKKNLIFKVTTILLLVVTLVLEILPNGAVLNFMADGNDELIRRTYSYFSLTLFGYANFGPLLTAVTTVVLLVLLIVFIFKSNKQLFKVIRVGLVFGLVFSLFPLFLSLKSYSLTGLFISISFLLVNVVFAFVKEKVEA